MRTCRNFLLKFAFFSIFCATSFCQMEMPSVSMPTISSSESPAMPKISVPTLGARFYAPGIVNTNISNKGNKTEPSENEKKSAIKNDDAAKSSKNQNVQAVSKALNYLSADDVSYLGSNGLFDGIYGLLGNDVAVSNKFSKNNQNDVLLNSVMAELSELKEKTEENSQALKKSNLPVTNFGAAGENSKFSPKILRFVVNGYNIKDTIRTVYFSKKENDGSFLLTGDRKYTSDGKSRDETFYLLFKADGNCGTSAGYFVEPQVIQDYKNEYSFLYQLTQKPKLKAEKTGNLASLKYVSDGWNLDFLLDIGNE